jgi:hypothetical protein
MHKEAIASPGKLITSYKLVVFIVQKEVPMPVPLQILSVQF